MKKIIISIYTWKIAPNIYSQISIPGWDNTMKNGLDQPSQDCTKYTAYAQTKYQISS